MIRKFLMFLIFISCCLLGCDNKATNQNLIFGEIGSGKLTEIYKLKDSSIIYSEFVNINYRDANTDIIKLSQALEHKKITIDEILSKSNKIDYANDGGSILYIFIGGENTLSATDFYVLKCKENDKGVRDIIFGTHNIVSAGCSALR